MILSNCTYNDTRVRWDKEKDGHMKCAETEEVGWG